MTDNPLTERRAKHLLFISLAEAFYSLAGAVRMIGRALEVYAKQFDD